MSVLEGLRPVGHPEAVGARGAIPLKWRLLALAMTLAIFGVALMLGAATRAGHALGLTQSGPVPGAPANVSVKVTGLASAPAIPALKTVPHKPVVHHSAPVVHHSAPPVQSAPVTPAPQQVQPAPASTPSPSPAPVTHPVTSSPPPAPAPQPAPVHHSSGSSGGSSGTGTASGGDSSSSGGSGTVSGGG